MGEYVNVSMPRSRGGPCDGARTSSGYLAARFYAAFSRRSLRQFTNLPEDRILRRFYAAFSRRSLRRRRLSIQST